MVESKNSKADQDINFVTDFMLFYVFVLQVIM